MDTNTLEKSFLSRLRLRGLSIQQRLSFFLCILLLCIIVAFGLAAYLGVKKAEIHGSQERLKTLSGQLGTMFGQSSQVYLLMTGREGAQDTIKKFIQSDGRNLRDEAQGLMRAIQKDTTVLKVELYNSKQVKLIDVSRPGFKININIDPLLGSLFGQPGASKIGKIYSVGDSMYYPAAAAVSVDNQVVGYIVKWGLLYVTPDAIAQFSKLIGTNGSLFVGNNDGSLWTDLVKPVSNPPVDTSKMNDLFEYSHPKTNRVIASAARIPNTPWLVLVEFSEKTILKTSNLILRWIIIIGAVLVVIGILIAWIMSRNITRPLNKLTMAASSFVAGDYTPMVDIGRKDEVGRLARAFNTMTSRVHEAQLILEKKVHERTEQLETANKELEAFSYSISHDLRAPLRALNGYATILKEDYGSKLDEEANRITGKIISNAKMMGQLIDDLISFSHMGVKELMYQDVNMDEMVRTCVAELLQQEQANKYKIQIGPLPSCPGDPNLIRQVWMNLLSNAIKYSSKIHSPEIEIGCTKQSDMNTYFVRDNGIGFNMQYAHKLFGVFQRLHSQKAFEGNGIGLAFVKRIIVKHNGEIHAQSSPGEGATFFFSLPSSKDILHLNGGAVLSKRESLIKSTTHEL